MQDLARAIKAAIQGDWCRQSDKAGPAVESLLASDPPLIRKSWIWMRGWYKDSVDRPPPPSRVALATMMTEKEKNYRVVPPPGEPIPVRDLPLSL